MDSLNFVEVGNDEIIEAANSLNELTDMQLAHIGGGCGETIAY